MFRSWDTKRQFIFSQLLSNSVGNVRAFRQPCGRWRYIAMQHALYVKHHNTTTLYTSSLNSRGI